jgi:hypothetical protein
MPFPLLGTLVAPVIELINKVIDRAIPDPAQQAAAKIELLKLQQAGEFKQLEADLQLALAQIDVNKIEAGSDGFFRSGWRPSIGWLCASGLFYSFILQTTLPWFAAVVGWNAPPLPKLEMDVLMTLLFGMLGLGAYRTYEKTRP